MSTISVSSVVVSVKMSLVEITKFFCTAPVKIGAVQKKVVSSTAENFVAGKVRWKILIGLCVLVKMQ